ncbi:MAG TPA: hypothetical protein DHV28_14020 [Ignavibacteriales bacterium]|nr:hypothetical protein [Ignavibacteriales bacterium]
MIDFLAEIVLVFVGYNVGYFFLKFFSGGKYPKEYMEEGGDLKIELFGIFMLLVLFAVASYVFI